MQKTQYEIEMREKWREIERAKHVPDIMGSVGNTHKIINGCKVCTGTHPDKHNFSGHSRGRKMHLTKDGERTLCNNLVDQYLPKEDKFWSVVSNGMCGNCEKLAKK